MFSFTLFNVLLFFSVFSKTNFLIEQASFWCFVSCCVITRGWKNACHTVGIHCSLLVEVGMTIILWYASVTLENLPKILYWSCILIIYKFIHLCFVMSSKFCRMWLSVPTMHKWPKPCSFQFHAQYFSRHHNHRRYMGSVSSLKR